ncbi:MAG TPA: NYN domain-containing protein [Crinalium sp.]
MDDSPLIEKISVSLHATLVSVQQNHPYLLADKYLTVPWESDRCKSTFIDKVSLELGRVPEKEDILAKVKQLLGVILIPAFFETSAFKELSANIQALLDESSHQNSQNLLPKQGSSETNAIAILLLDAENIQLSNSEEQLLTKSCHFKLQIKVAFANWKNTNIAQKDAEFHQRGYQLIHVPSGKNSADIKMTAVGSSLFMYYPMIKEVLVCSSDSDLIHLCNTLQSHGLAVHLVQRKANGLTAKNLTTGEIKIFSNQPCVKIPPLETCILWLEVLIRCTQEETLNHWIKLSELSQKFRDKHGFTISQIVQTHMPGKKARDIFTEYPSSFVVHQVEGKGEIYVSLFKIDKSVNSQTGKNEQEQKNAPKEAIVSNQFLLSIKSRSDLEKALSNILIEMTRTTSTPFISIVELHHQFQSRYG